MADQLPSPTAGQVPERFMGTVYLLHFDRPYEHARHYIGWARDVTARLAQHEVGKGANLLQVVRNAGITWTLARTWPGTRQRERQIKNMGGASRRCPLCGVHPRPETVSVVSAGELMAYRLRELTARWWYATDPAERARLDREIEALTDQAPCAVLPGAITAFPSMATFAA